MALPKAPLADRCWLAKTPKELALGSPPINPMLGSRRPWDRGSTPVWVVGKGREARLLGCSQSSLDHKPCKSGVSTKASSLDSSLLLSVCFYVEDRALQNHTNTSQGARMEQRDREAWPGLGVGWPGWVRGSSRLSWAASWVPPSPASPSGGPPAP